MTNYEQTNKTKNEHQILNKQTILPTLKRTFKNEHNNIYKP